MSLPWKPAAALPHFAEMTSILVAYRRAGPHPDDANPVLAGIYLAHGMSVESEETADPPDGDDWLWVLETEALEGIASADMGDEIFGQVEAHMAAVTGAPAESTCIGCGCTDSRACDDGWGACHWLRVDRVAGLGVCSCCEDQIGRWDAGHRWAAPAAPATPVNILARVPGPLGVAVLVNITGIPFAPGLILGPRIVRRDGGWYADAEAGVAIYDEISGDALASGDDADSARLQLAALVRAVGGEGNFRQRLQRAGALKAAAGEVA